MNQPVSTQTDSTRGILRFTCKVIQKFAALAISFTLIVCAGCTNHYTPPVLDVPSHWNSVSGPSLPPNNAMESGGIDAWLLNCFQDQNLEKLFAIAKEHNLDYRIGATRLQQARAYYNVQKSHLLPSLNASASAGYNHISSNTPSGLLLNAPGFSSNLFDASFDATWELDIFGRVNATKQAAKLSLEAAYLRQESLWISLHCEITRSYLLWCGYVKQIELLQECITAQENQFLLIKERLQSGIASPLVVAQAQASLEGLRAALPPLQHDALQILYTLDLLVGKAPGFCAQELSCMQMLPTCSKFPTLGVPSDLLRRRPDIRAAERELSSMSKLVDVAKLDFFPSFTLSGVLGHQSMFAKDLSDSSSHYWSFVPGLRLPIFQAGALKAKLHLSKARANESLLLYEKSVLQALGEVESNFDGYTKLEEELFHLALATASSEEALRLSLAQYEQGTLDFLDVLQAQQVFLENKRTWISSQMRLSMQVVALTKALGGGWPSI